jgi:cysteine desulfurase
MKNIIYLDNAATTPIEKRTEAIMKKYFLSYFGNPSSNHSTGRVVREAIKKSREIIAKSLNALPEEIIFTSGGTESNNMALFGLAYAHPEKKHIIISKIEHDSIEKVCQTLEKRGYLITRLNVNEDGFIDLNELERSITPKTLLVSIIHGNNEIGTVQDIKAIGQLCKQKNILFHIDACQSYLKEKLDVKIQSIDLISINSHKINGPKGIGALFVRKEVNLSPIIIGGGQEYGLRSGTENVPAIIGFAQAVKYARRSEFKKIKSLRDYAIRRILKIENTKLNGSWKKRLCNNINISFSDIEGESIASNLEQMGIMISTGSACASISLKKSRVLKAIGLDDMNINSSIRVSLGKFNTKKQLIIFISELNKIVNRLRIISPFAKL